MEPTQAPAQPTLDGTSALLEGAVSSTAEVGAKVFVRDLADGARVESPFVVRDVARRQKRNGDSFLKLQLGDVTGAVEGVVWDGIDEAAATATFPGIDRDLAVTGALLHDIGKIEAYAMEGGAIDLSNAGRLQSEIPLGYYIVRREIEDLPGFPPDRAEGLLHIILSHHGQLEHGSPVVPCTREATLVHMIDNLGGRLGSFDRIEKSLPGGERWSSFDRALAGPAYFATRGLGEAA